MKCDICNRRIQRPGKTDKFYSTGPLIQRGYCCEECYLTWVLPYREEQEKLMPKGMKYFCFPSDTPGEEF